jgi:hypothetical protein
MLEYQRCYRCKSPGQYAGGSCRTCRKTDAVRMLESMSEDRPLTAEERGRLESLRRDLSPNAREGAAA